MVQAPNRAILALDVGERRIGVARATEAARLPSPLTTLENNLTIWTELKQICNEQRIVRIVIGLPRSLSGQATAQTKYVENFATEARAHLGLPIQFQDEAVTSKQAERELIARGKPFNKGDIDALAATYILEDYLREN